MLNFISQLISADTEPSDGLNQSQREAILELLLLCEYADNHLAAVKESFLIQTAQQLSWTSSESVSDYLNRITPKVREVRSDKNARQSFIQSLAAKLETDPAKQRAYELTKSLFKSDGTLAPEEKEFDNEIKQALGL